MNPVWLSVADVLALHDEAMAEFGGAGGLRDAGLLESALARPRNRVAYGKRPTVFDLAGAYCVGVARNHPFVDGNKRVAFLVAAVFLDLNGYRLTAAELDVVETIGRVAEGRISETALSAWFKRNSRSKRGRNRR